MRMKLKSLNERGDPILELENDLPFHTPEEKEKMKKLITQLNTEIKIKKHLSTESPKSEKEAMKILEKGIVCEQCKKVVDTKDNEEEIMIILKGGTCKSCWLNKTGLNEKDILLREKLDQELESYKENEINWVDDDFWKDWDSLKGHCKKMLKHKKGYAGEPPKLYFVAHDKDTIRGKPELIERVQKKIPLLRCAIKKVDEMIWDVAGITKIKTGNKIDLQSFYFFDEKFDKRHDGFQVKALALDFWIYRIISQEGKEYYILTQEKLPNCTCNFKGMLVELDDFAEMSRSLKMKSLSRLFFLKDFEPDIKILTKKELIEYTKLKNIDETGWLNFLALHRFGNYNRFPEEVEMLKSAFILAGKTHEYPLHIAILGTAGSKKTMGWIETISYKFSEEPKIVEGADSRIKGLSPSFKEKPANIGYLAKQERIGFVDEIGKMVEFESIKSHNPMNNSLGELNFLLEHKKRQVSSGNDNECEVQATAKYLFATNPISNKKTISQHIGIIDPTTMSRMLWWVQDYNEISYVMSEKGVEKTSRTPKQAHEEGKDIDIGIEIRNKNTFHEKSSVVLNRCPRDDFLTLFDTCYSFICEIDEEKVVKLVKMTINLANEPMKSSVWKPRAEHHVELLIDGLVKHRCLFKDYDDTFTAKDEDYTMAERILVRMVRGWDTNLSPKEEFR